MYEPQVDDYVKWTNKLGQVHEGWVYFKGDPVDNEKRIKDGWKVLSRYITTVSYTHLTLPTILRV